MKRAEITTQRQTRFIIECKDTWDVETILWSLGVKMDDIASMIDLDAAAPPPHKPVVNISSFHPPTDADMDIISAEVAEKNREQRMKEARMGVEININTDALDIALDNLLDVLGLKIGAPEVSSIDTILGKLAAEAREKHQAELNKRNK